MAAPISPDAALIAMVHQYDALSAAWPLEGATEELMYQVADLEPKIIATPAFTDAGLAGKRRVVKRAELVDRDEIIAAILARDAARVGAAG